jgi:hypothetical protein
MIRQIVDNDDNNNALSAIATNGKSKSIFDFNTLGYFYNIHKKHPNIYRFDSDDVYFRYDDIIKKLKKEYKEFEIIFTDATSNVDDKTYQINEQFIKLTDDIFISINGLIGNNMMIDGYDDIKDTQLITNFNMLVNGVLDKKILTDINKSLNTGRVKEKENISIGIVSISDGQYYVKDFNIIDKILNLKDLDLHYGAGFEEFHNKLVERMLKETKGLVLFHGSPGSGKTTIVRHLIKTIKQRDKKNNVLYFPPTMVSSITDPGFIDFISEWAYDTEGKNYLLIEDAEPLLESRKETRNLGITNLLNLTDGLLNDILDLQIIATFNTDLKNIDVALLRPERLLGRKSFNKLSKENAKKLAISINIDPDTIDTEMTLADIYSMKNKTTSLIHDVITTESKIGFGSK